ncbi:amidase family protein [Streptomyces sp. NPDC048361]|uniref:amidase n=1 Tax=Streptomyces sp. NPDC048361 TaxID=3154720 RepID=UPI003419830E
MTAWAGRTAVEISDAVRRKEVTPREVVGDHLAGIAARDGRIGAFRVVRAAAALDEADAVGARDDLAELPLAGVPVAVKDNLAVRGESTRNGSAATSAAPAAEDHVLVARLRAAGAVVVGLTHVPELCVFGTTDGVHGTARNPWDPARTAGGSSGGSAAAVAAGFVPLAIGNDGMGSLRIPAAHCGLIGLKPGTGRVPRDLGGGWYGMSENGPLATTTADARLMFAVLAGETARDAVAESPAAPGSPRGAGTADAGRGSGTAPGPRLRIAFSTRAPITGVRVGTAYAALAREAARALSRAGHHVALAHPPYPLSFGAVVLAHWAGGTAQDAEGLDARLLAPRTRRHAAVGRLAGRLGMLRSDHSAALNRRLEPFFDTYDVLLTPALARRGAAAGAWHERGWLANVLMNTACSPMTPPWNLSGRPALAMPFGSLPTGLPGSVQLVGRPGSEHQLLDLAAELEHLHPWERTAPTLRDPARA